MIYAPVNKIIPHSVVDGVGNRMAVFFQGCNFRCSYCHNPETINVCNNCGECVKVCPASALVRTDNKVIYAKELCIDCDECIKTCKNLSSPKISFYTPAQLSEIAKEQIPFISGVTCSGGESTLQSDFMTQFFRLNRANGLTNLIDTNGGIDLSEKPDLMAVTDGVMLDIKAFEKNDHQKLTGTDNSIVLKNAQYLACVGKLTELRTVCLSDADNIKIVTGILSLLSDTPALNELTYKIIRYRSFGVREEFSHLSAPPEEEMQRIFDIVKSFGVKNVVLI